MKTGKISYFTSLLLVITLLSGQLLFGQVKGIVRDIESGIPIQGALIQSDISKTISDIEGQFTIDASPESKLNISHIGYFEDSLDVIESKEFISVFLSLKSYGLDQVLVRSPLLHEKHFSMPSSIGVLKKQELTRSDQISFIGALNNLSGVYVHEGTLSTSRITVRGMGARTPYASNRIKAYFNDIPLSTGDGSTLIEDIDPSFIQSISLVKGAKSAMYGNGIGGVLLLTGKNYFKEGVEGGIELEGASYSTIKPSAWIHYRENDFALSSGYSFVQTDGYRENSSYDRHSANFLVALNKEKLEINFLFHLINVKGYIPSSLNEEDFKNSPYKAASNWLSVEGHERYLRILNGLKIKYVIDEKFELNTILSGNWSKAYESRPFNILDDQSIQLGLKSFISYKNRTFKLRSGIDYVFENYQWTVFSTDLGVQGEERNRFKEYRQPLSIFIQSDYSFDEKLLIETGISYNLTTYKLYDLFNASNITSESHSYKPALSPFIGMNYSISSQWKSYGSIGHGFSLPSVEETLLPEGQINPGLKAESGINYEIGVRYQSFDGNLFFDASSYLMNVKDLLITKRLSEDVFYGENAGKTRHMGIELMGGYRFNHDRIINFPETHLNISLSIAENKFVDFIDEGVDYSGNDVPGIPGTTLTANLNFLLRKEAFVNMDYRFSGAQFINDANDEKYGAYHYTAIKLIKAFEFTNNSKIKFYLGVKNILNTNYASMILINAPSFGGKTPRYYYPGKPRHLYGGVRYDF